MVMKDKLVWQVSAVVVGGALGIGTDMEVRILILAFFLMLLIRLWFLWKPIDFYGRLRRPEVLLLICGLVIGFLYGFHEEKNLPSPVIIESIKVEGRLTDWVLEERTARGMIKLDSAVIATADNNMIEGLGKKYTVRLYPDSKGIFEEIWLNIKPGDRITFVAKLEHPKPPGTVGEFDLPLYNAVRGLSGAVTVRGEVRLLEQGVPPLSWSIRQKVRIVLDQHWAQEAGILEGILFGDSSRIPSDTLNMYKAAGVMHVFAASGANIAFVIALMWALLFFLPRNARIAVTIGAIVLYVCLCKANPPILRAAILGIAVLLGMLGREKVSSIRWLMIAAFLLFLWNPLYLRDVSFQLSFAATWGIVVLSPRLLKSNLMQKVPSLIRHPVAVALSVQIAALPIMIIVFQRVSLAGLMTNIFILVILGTVLQLGLIAISLIWLPIIHLAFFQVSFWLLAITDSVLSIFASLPLAYLWVLNPGAFFWILWYGLLGVLLIGKEKVWFIFRVQLRKLYRIISSLPRLNNISSHSILKRINATLTKTNNSINYSLKNIIFLCLASIVIILMLWAPWQGVEQLRITFLDVGQGDCILIRTSRENVLVDSGPKNDRFDAGERIIVPYLMEHRIGYLDMFFITHEHADHIGGAKYILGTIPTGKIAIPEVGVRLDNEEWQEGLLRDVNIDQEKIVKLQAGNNLQFASGLSLKVLSPRETLYLTSSDANNNSLVLVLEYLDKKILLTGDMELEQMQAITNRGADWNANFIKIPHHGSASSLDIGWFNRTQPQAVFIQVGRNSFGHPAPEVLAYWETRGVPVYRTDIHGTIDLVIDKKGVSIIPGRKSFLF